MRHRYFSHIRALLDQIRADGYYKAERVIESPQSSTIELAGGERVLNFCANNYLGLANDWRLVQAAKDGLDQYGFGMSSVRFICGTQTVHKRLEAALSKFLGTDDSILYSSCFDANAGLFETILGEEDAVIALHEDWQRNQQAKTQGYLSGELLRNIHVPYEFVAIMRFENRAFAQALANDPERNAWYRRLVSLVENVPVLTEYTREWPQ